MSHVKNKILPLRDFHVVNKEEVIIRRLAMAVFRKSFIESRRFGVAFVSPQQKWLALSSMSADWKANKTEKGASRDDAKIETYFFAYVHISTSNRESRRPTNRR